MNLKRISRILLAVLWLSTFSTALVWILMNDPPFDPEPVTVVLGLLSTAITALLSEYSSRLEQESFSPAYALAYGYMNNFVEPVLTQLIRQHGPRVKLMIYVPEKLSELEPKSIDRIMARIRERKFSDQIINLDVAEGRARDILFIRKSEGVGIYFDFPSTLLTLNSFLDYKIKGLRNPSVSTREEWGRKYIAKFQESTREIAVEKGLLEHIQFIDKNLGF